MLRKSRSRKRSRVSGKKPCVRGRSIITGYCKKKPGPKKGSKRRSRRASVRRSRKVSRRRSRRASVRRSRRVSRRRSRSRFSFVDVFENIKSGEKDSFKAKVDAWNKYVGKTEKDEAMKDLSNQPAKLFDSATAKVAAGAESNSAQASKVQPPAEQAKQEAQAAKAEQAVKVIETTGQIPKEPSPPSPPSSASPSPSYKGLRARYNGGTPSNTFSDLLKSAIIDRRDRSIRRFNEGMTDIDEDRVRKLNKLKRERIERARYDSYVKNADSTREKIISELNMLKKAIKKKKSFSDINELPSSIRDVCMEDGEKCSNCYYYGAPCLNCSEYFNFTKPNAKMTWEEYKKEAGIDMNYENFCEENDEYSPRRKPKCQTPVSSCKLNKKTNKCKKQTSKRRRSRK